MRTVSLVWAVFCAAMVAVAGVQLAERFSATWLVIGGAALVGVAILTAKAVHDRL